GSEDFAADIGAQADPEVLFYPKQRTLLAAKAAGIMPMGFVGSIADFRDQDAFRAIVRRSRRMGFMCASAIHPLQVQVLNEEFQPTAEEIDRAEKMIAAYDKAYAEGLGAVQFEGAMIDVPVVNRARTVLARAKALAARGG
ncbi:MAG: CoA ester lyase, partial [Acetobacteraceae bacterium]